MQEVIIKTKTASGVTVTLFISSKNVEAEMYFAPQHKNIRIKVFRDAHPEYGATLRGIYDNCNVWLRIPESTIDKAYDVRFQLLDEERDKQESELESKIPGVRAIKALINELDKTNEYNDRAVEEALETSVCAPEKPTKSLKEQLKAARAEHPRASQYIRAESYRWATDYHKSRAGKRAMERLLNGASAEEAKAILDNWAPEESIWD